MRTFKHRRWSASDPTLAVSDDIILMTATFLNLAELSAFGCVCRRFTTVQARETVWKLRALDVLPAEEVEAAMSALDLTSHRQLLEIFTRVGIPHGVLGFWKTDSPAPSWSNAGRPFHGRVSSTTSSTELSMGECADARGELLRIRLVSSGFLCETVTPKGAFKSVFTIRISTTGRRIMIGYFSMEGDEDSTQLGGSSWVPGRPTCDFFLSRAMPVPDGTEQTPIHRSGKDGFCLPRANGRVCRFTKIEKPFPLDSVLARPTPEAMALGLCGLWSACYGIHGFETINLTVNAPAAGAGGADVEPAKSKALEQAASPHVSGPRQWVSQKTSSSSGSVCTSSPASLDSDAGGCCCSSDGSESVVEEEHGLGEDEGPEYSMTGNVKPETRSQTETHTTSKVKRGCPSSQSTSGAYSTDEQLDTDAEADDEQDKQTGMEDFGGEYQHPRLYGTKVTGDPNVPAGELSFVVDIDKACDVDDELEADTRPVVFFLANGAVMANLSNRRDSIAFWRKGRGQINRTPGRWSPEWVDIDFIMYQPGERCSFSVIFRQPVDLRVIMDFGRMFEADDWPQWR